MAQTDSVGKGIIMRKFVVSYLHVAWDGRGNTVFRLEAKVLDAKLLDFAPETLDEFAEQISRRGFLDKEQNTWIMPGAIMSIKEQKSSR